MIFKYVLSHMTKQKYLGNSNSATTYVRITEKKTSYELCHRRKKNII